jgi:hypothetical protein
MATAAASTSRAWYLTAVVVAGLATAKEFDWPPKFWSTPPTWIVRIFIVSAAFAATLPFRGAFSEFRSRQKRAQQILPTTAADVHRLHGKASSLQLRRVRGSATNGIGWRPPERVGIESARHSRTAIGTTDLPARGHSFPTRSSSPSRAGSGDPPSPRGLSRLRGQLGPGPDEGRRDRPSDRATTVLTTMPTGRLRRLLLGARNSTDDGLTWAPSTFIF